MMSRALLRSVLLQMVLIFLFAWASGYELPSFEDADWRTVTFLTPSGLITNALSEDPVMRSFYGDVPPGRLGEGARPDLMALIFAILVWNGVRILRGSRPESA